jgi:membrane peptidoglycan carboxypeptidase
MAHRVGIESPLNPVLSIALGTQSVSPLEMAAAYSTIANYGEKVDPYLIERIEDADGNVIYQHRTERERVLDAALSAAVVSTLEKVITSGTATGADIGRPAAGKTGTAQDYRDVWFMGFIPQYTTAVWVGYADAQIEMVNFTVHNDLTGNDQYYSRAFGGSLAAPIWKQFMLYIAEDLPIQDFPEAPEGTSAYFQVPLVEVPSIAGLSLEDARSAIQSAGLNAVVTNVASPEPEGTILGQSPAAGTKISQGRTVSILVSSGVPPVMADFSRFPLNSLPDRFAEFNEETGLNLTFEIVNARTNRPGLNGRVVDQSPAPGAPLEFGQTVTFTIGVYRGE